MTESLGNTSSVLAKADIWVIIPAYKEEQIIGKVIANVLAHYPNVVVISDGSPDRTAEEAAAAGAAVLKHAINLGQGAALQTGIDYALARGAKFLVTFDADGQHSCDDVAILLRELTNKQADLAIGSRFLGRAEGMGWWRGIVLKCATVFNFLMTGKMLTDAHNGLRVLTADAARKIRIRQNRMAHATEILESAARLKLKLIEVPVVIVYSEYSKAKGQRLGNSFSIVLDLIGAKVHR